MDKKTIKEQLARTFCYKCGSGLDGANFVPISDTPVASTAHITCPNCRAESLMTITLAGSGVLPVTTDLKPEEIRNFVGQPPISTDNLLDLHLLLKKGSLWSLLHKKELSLAKKAKELEKRESSQP